VNGYKLLNTFSFKEPTLHESTSLKILRFTLADEIQNAVVGSGSRRMDWLAGFVCLGAGMTLFARHFWVADIIANLRVQLILGLLGTLVILLFLRRWRMVLVVTAVTIWQASWLISAFQPAPVSTNSQERPAAFAPAVQPQQLRVFLANVLTRNQQHGHITAQIREADPDVIVILELSSKLNATLHREFGESHQYAISEPQDDGNFGIGLWSRFSLTDASIFHLNSQWYPSIEADVEFNSRRIRVFVTHPLPPVGSRNFAHRNKHLALLAKRIQQHRNDDPECSRLLLGDLNLTPWSPFFSDLCSSSGLKNAAVGHGLQPTWYCGNLFPFGLVLDHALHCNDLRCIRREILPANGSDHRAIIFDMVLCQQDQPVRDP
jgi:endonuclease/exonuclease/phosphatase (EEP) superfamily protein YafD